MISPNEIFTITETDNKKFEVVINNFLKSFWSIKKVKFKILKARPSSGYVVVWVAILERGELGLGNPPTIRTEAILNYYNPDGIKI